MKRLLLTLTILVLMAFILQAQAASVPHLINYQGMLTNAQGDPLETSEYKLTFKIFQQSTGGTAVWGPQVFEQVPVVRGNFNVILGPTDSINRKIVAAFASGNAYLEITIGNGAPIAPRQQILSTPYALNGVPAGTIIAFGGDAIPDGWLLCNGECVSDKKYPALFEAISTCWGDGSADSDKETNFNIPDLIGYFLRGKSYGWGRDPDRQTRIAARAGGNIGDAVGSIQYGATQRPGNPFTTDIKGNHNHGNVLYHHSPPDNGGTGQRDIHWNVRETTGPYAGDHSHTITGGGDSETRPMNAYVNWIIKY